MRAASYIGAAGVILLALGLLNEAWGQEFYKPTNVSRHYQSDAATTYNFLMDDYKHNVLEGGTHYEGCIPAADRLAHTAQIADALEHNLGVLGSARFFLAAGYAYSTNRIEFHMRRINEPSGDGVWTVEEEAQAITDAVNGNYDTEVTDEYEAQITYVDSTAECNAAELDVTCENKVGATVGCSADMEAIHELSLNNDISLEAAADSLLAADQFHNDQAQCEASQFNKGVSSQGEYFYCAGPCPQGRELNDYGQCQIEYVGGGGETYDPDDFFGPDEDLSYDDAEENGNVGVPTGTPISDEESTSPACRFQPGSTVPHCQYYGGDGCNCGVTSSVTPRPADASCTVYEAAIALDIELCYGDRASDFTNACSDLTLEWRGDCRTDSDARISAWESANAVVSAQVYNARNCAAVVTVPETLCRAVRYGAASLSETSDFRDGVIDVVEVPDDAGEYQAGCERGCDAYLIPTNDPRTWAQTSKGYHLVDYQEANTPFPNNHWVKSKGGDWVPGIDGLEGECFDELSGAPTGSDQTVDKDTRIVEVECWRSQQIITAQDFYNGGYTREVTGSVVVERHEIAAQVAIECPTETLCSGYSHGREPLPYTGPGGQGGGGTGGDSLQGDPCVPRGIDGLLNAPEEGADGWAACQDVSGKLGIFNVSDSVEELLAEIEADANTGGGDPEDPCEGDDCPIPTPEELGFSQLSRSGYYADLFDNATDLKEIMAGFLPVLDVPQECPVFEVPFDYPGLDIGAQELQLDCGLLSYLGQLVMLLALYTSIRMIIS